MESVIKVENQAIAKFKTYGQRKNFLAQGFFLFWMDTNHSKSSLRIVVNNLYPHLIQNYPLLFKIFCEILKDFMAKEFPQFSSRIFEDYASFVQSES